MNTNPNRFTGENIYSSPEIGITEIKSEIGFCGSTYEFNAEHDGYTFNNYE